jgi:hypothetical protein
MIKKDLKISLILQGPESEKGFIRLDNLLSQLAALQEALESIDRAINGKGTVYYRVVNLSKKNPTKIVIEPVLKQRLKKVMAGNRWGHLPEQVHHSFFQTMQYIRKNDRRRLEKVGEPVIDAIAALFDGLGTEFVSGSIANSRRKFNLDDSLKQRVEQLLTPEFKSYGSVEGQLLAVNVARGNRFYIYPETGPRSISCHFPESMFEKAQACLRKNVRVYGDKFYRESTGWPCTIKNVTDLEILELDQPFPDFKPSPITFAGTAADELIKESREEWD